MIQAIIFDFDGLIFDTETHEYEVYQEIFQSYNCHLSLDLWGKSVGSTLAFEPFDLLEEQSKTTLNHKELKELMKVRWERRLASEKVRDGVEDYLNMARDLGLKVGLASSSDYSWVSRHLTNLGLIDKFDCIRTSDYVEEVKPNPALYLEAAACLGVDQKHCLAFEDSANGALAAKRAGMHCVIVPNKITKDLDFGDVDYRLSSMSDMKLNELIKYIEDRVEA